MVENLDQYTTSQLHSLIYRIKHEIDQRKKGVIPEGLTCDICSCEFEGDKYQFDEESYACNVCYDMDYNVRKNVSEWESLISQLKN